MYALTKSAVSTGSVAEAEEAVRLVVRLLAATPLGSANRALHVTNAGLAYRALYEITGDEAALDAALRPWQEAATARTVVTYERMNAAIHRAVFANWIAPVRPGPSTDSTAETQLRDGSPSETKIIQWPACGTTAAAE